MQLKKECNWRADNFDLVNALNRLNDSIAIVIAARPGENSASSDNNIFVGSYTASIMTDLYVFT